MPVYNIKPKIKIIPSCNNNHFLDEVRVAPLKRVIE